MTETGGIVQFKPDFPRQSRAPRARASYMFSLASQLLRAAQRLPLEDHAALLLPVHGRRQLGPLRRRARQPRRHAAQGLHDLPEQGQAPRALRPAVRASIQSGTVAAMPGSTSTPTPRPARRRRCGAPWPRPRWATSSASRTRRSTRCARAWPTCSASRPRCSSPPARCATRSRSGCTSGRAATRRCCTAPPIRCASRPAARPRMSGAVLTPLDGRCGMFDAATLEAALRRAGRPLRAALPAGVGRADHEHRRRARVAARAACAPWSTSPAPTGCGCTSTARG